MPRCLRSELVDEFMSSIAKTPIRGDLDGGFHGRVADCDFRREVPKPTISRYQTRYAQVGPSARARARRRAREPPESEFRELTEMLSTIAGDVSSLPSESHVCTRVH